MKMKRVILMSLLLILIKETYPQEVFWNPVTLADYVKANHQIINPTNKPYYFIDPHNYIQKSDVPNLLFQMETIYNEYKVKVMLVIINQMEPQFRTDSGIELFTNGFAVTLLGNNTLDDYVTILFSIKDRQFRITTGRNVRSTYTDRWCARLGEYIVPSLKCEYYLKTCQDSLYYLYHYNRLFFDLYYAEIGVSIFGIIIGIIALVSAIQESRTLSKIEKFVAKLEKENNPQESLNDTCIICLEKFNISSQEKVEQSEKMKDLVMYHEQNCAVLHCRHKFHSACLAKWLAVQNSCPLCKEIVMDNEESGENTNVERVHTPSARIIYVQREIHPFLRDYRYDRAGLIFRRNKRSGSHSSGGGGWGGSGGFSGRW